MKPRIRHVWRPFAGWPTLTSATLRADVTAALTGSIVVLPQGVAFATLAGLPPQYGLYAAMVPAVVAALFGSSWHLVSGPTNAVSIVIFATMSALAEPGSAHYIELVLCLTLVTGILQLSLGLARLGALVNLISHTVVVAFTSGAALLIVASQLRNFFGVPISRGASFVETLTQLAAKLPETNLFVLAVGCATLLTSIGLRIFLPRVPYMIVALIVGSCVAVVLDQRFGNAATGIATVGSLSAFLPPVSLPNLSLALEIAPAALACTLLGLTEAISIGRSIGIKSGQRIDGNREFIGQGLSNIAGSFFSSYVASGSFNRSGLNYESGARTPLAAILSAPFLVGILFFVAPLAAFVPLASMAAILFMVAWGLIDVREALRIARTSQGEAVVLVLTFLATVLLQLEMAILIGVISSMMLYLYRTTRPTFEDVKPALDPSSYHFSADTGLPDCPQLKMVRLHGSVFFGAVEHVHREISAIPQAHVLILASGINFVDFAGAEMLVEESRRRRKLGGGLYFYRMTEEVKQFLTSRGRYISELGRENILDVRTNVIAKLYPRLDSNICRTCQARIFAQCQGRLPSGEDRS